MSFLTILDLVERAAGQLVSDAAASDDECNAEETGGLTISVSAGFSFLGVLRYVGFGLCEPRDISSIYEAFDQFSSSSMVRRLRSVIISSTRRSEAAASS